MLMCRRALRCAGPVFYVQTFYECKQCGLVDGAGCCEVLLRLLLCCCLVSVSAQSLRSLPFAACCASRWLRFETPISPFVLRVLTS